MKLLNRHVVGKILVPAIIVTQIGSAVLATNINPSPETDNTTIPIEIKSQEGASDSTTSSAIEIEKENNKDITVDETIITKDNIVSATASDTLIYGGVTYGPENAVDGDKETHWDTNDTALGNNDGTQPAYLQVELDNEYYINQVDVLARQNHTNGGIRQYELYVGDSEETLVKIKQGTFNSQAIENSPVQTIKFDVPIRAKFIRLVAKTGVAQNVCIAEMTLHKVNQDATKDASIQAANYKLGNDGKTINIESVGASKHYEVVLEPGTVELPILEVTPKNGKAQVQIEQVKNLGETATVTVTSEDGTTTQEYTFAFNVRKGNTDTKLKAIKFNGRNYLGLDKDSKAYKITLPMDTKAVVIEPTLNDPKATFEVTTPTVFPGTGTVKVIAEDTSVTDTYTFEFEVAATADGHLMKYAENYDEITTDKLNWEKISESGKLTATVENSKLKIDAAPELLAIDKKSPKLVNGQMTCDFNITKGEGRTGFIVRGVDQDNYGSICYDNGSWVWVCANDGKETYGNLFTYAIENNKDYNLKIRYVGNSYKIWINNEELFSGTLDNLPTMPGYVGIRTWHNQKTVLIDNLSVKEIGLKEQPVRPADAEYISISDGAYGVSVDSSFPIIEKYTVDGNDAFSGQHQYATGIAINGQTVYPEKVEVTGREANKVSYKITINDEVDDKTIAAAITCSLGIKEDQDKDGVLTFSVDSIEEHEGQIKTLKFENQGLITVEGKENGYGNIICGGGWGSISDQDVKLDSIQEQEKSGTYAFLYNQNYCAAIDNNVMDASSKLNIKHTIVGDVPKASFSSGGYTYRAVKPEIAQQANLPETEALPTTKIIISKDKNGDGNLDWQDGAVAFRKIMKVPKGGDEIRNNITYVAMNFISTASNPFLRVLDNGKVLSHYTDGFGQMIINKGYQAEGHDDSFPSFDNIGIRHGGAKDFNVLIDEGHKYNIKNGVHVNVGEYMLDSMDIKMDNMVGDLGSLSSGWGWVDQAYYVDQDKDLLTGEVERRFDALKDKAPNLDFLYVDIYSGADWRAKKVADIIHKNDWMLATEFGGPFEGDQILTHWGTDLYYPATESSSKMYRFVFNHLKDMYNGESLLKGMKQPGVASWQNRTNLFEGVEVFYNQNLPSKYMQYFPILKRTMEQRNTVDKENNPIVADYDTRVDFEGGAYVAEEDGHAKLYSKDKNLIAIMSLDANRAKSTVFIPWNPETEDKIYHWNNDGGTTTWTLPNSWNGVNTVYVFKTTSTGREYVGTLDVSSNKVTIAAEKQVGYILTKDRNQSNGLPEETIWGEGSLIRDNGFESKTWNDAWKKSSAAGTTDHIQFTTDDKYKTELHISGTQDAKVEQAIVDLKPGKTYTISAWVDTTRPVILTADIGEVHEEASIDNNKITNFIEAHRYNRTQYQRIKLDITVPEGITTGTVSINMPKVNQEGLAKIDDLRIVELPSKTDKHKDGAVYFDDFENIDEGWGPFEYAGGSGQTHLAYKDPEGRQIIDYVIDGKWSLKSNEWERTGEMFRTHPSIVTFKENTEYEVTMDYTIFKKLKGTMVAANDNGISVAIKDEDGKVITEQPLTNSIIEAGKPVPQKVTLRFNTKDSVNPYFVTETQYMNGANIFVVDNFMVKEISDINKPNKGNLEAVIKEAQEAHDKAVEGRKKDQYPTGSKKKLMDAIQVAKVVYANEQASEEILKTAENTLNSALVAFKESVNKRDLGGGTSSSDSSTAETPKPEPAVEKLEKEWKAVSSDEQVAIKKAVEEFMPYTTLKVENNLEQLAKLTNGKFSKEQLALILKDKELAKKLGITIDNNLTVLKPIEKAAFKDLPQRHWAHNTITELAKMGIVAGYEDNSFKPNQALGVADTFTFLDRMLLIHDVVTPKLPKSTVEKYVTDKENWAFYPTASIGSKLSEETLKTIMDTKGAPLKRELLAQVIYEVTEGKLPTTLEKQNFKDIKDANHKQAIDYCVMTGILKGTGKTTMSPEKSVTRAEMMAILERLNKLLK
ncbi:MAG: endo-alpha-N-acetylgalactosaminidase family protein [Cellulosilyticaceae bacterium]